MTVSRLLAVVWAALVLSAVVRVVVADGATLVAPVATTGAASAIAGTTVTLNGTVNPNGAATTWQFEYGTTTAYGTKAPSTAASAGSGNGNISVSTNLTGLEGGVTYHVRLTATNATGTTVGTDGTFATTAIATIITGATTKVTTSSATVGCTVDPNGVSTTWAVEYGSTTSYGTQTSPQSAGSGTNATNLTTTLTGLTGATAYHFRCIGSSGGTTIQGADATFSTAEAPIVKTGTPSTIGATSTTVTGTVDPRSRSTTYYVEYGTSTGYGSKSSTSSAGSGASIVNVSKYLGSLKAGTVYHYRLVATSDAGTTRGDDVSFTTLGAPLVVTGGSSSIGATSATVAGSINPSGATATWWVEYGATTSYGTRTSSRSAGSGTTAQEVTVLLSGLQPATTYHYRVVASNSRGTASGADASFATAGPPTVSTGQVPITSLSPGGAKVTGTVNPRGLATTAWFEYGPTPSYGQRTTQVDVGSALADVPFEAEIRGLVPGTRTFFRLVAVSAAGSGKGVGKSFGTPSASFRGRKCTIAGTQARDVLVGTAGPDVICGLAGDDVIRGLGGDDILVGGPGNDVIDGGDGADVIAGGQGDDVIKGGAGADQIDGQAGNDQILGGGGTDTLRGGPGDDRIAARDRKADVVDGGDGTDSAIVDPDLDQVIAVERRRA